MGLKEAEEGQETLFLSLGLAGAQQFGPGKWVPTSELAPLVPLVGSSSFAENSIIMIAYDVNDAPRQQLFPSERARGVGRCGSRRCRRGAFTRTGPRRDVDGPDESVDG